ncbi:NACHT domain-containing protein [Micromonospora zhanjiangensis]
MDADRIESLRAELAARHTCSIFADPTDLAARVTAAVAMYLAENLRPAPLPQPFSDTIKHYFGRLRQHYGMLDLDALTPAPNDEYLQIELGSVFVEPSVREDPPPAELPREWRRRMQAHGAIGSDDVPDEVDPAELVQLNESYRAKPLQRVFDVLTDPERRTVVLLGDPGSGKSTIARHLALSLTEDRPHERLAHLADHLPLLIELRSYVTAVADGRCAGFLDYLDRHAASDGLGVERAALLRQLTAGRVVAIFDGLDEVFDPRQREDVACEIVNFAADFPQARVVVTSRTIGYARRILTDAGFDHFTLQDLDDQQAGDFLAGWYRSARPGHPAEAEQGRARLLDAMRHSYAIRELAGNPLLLTILAIIGNHQALPQERWRLYDHAATVLVEHWDVNRHLRKHNNTQLAFLDTEDKKELLRRLAYRMQANERGLTVNYVPTEELSEVFEQYLMERYQRDPATARAVALSMIGQFRERNFILSRYGPHVHGFVHRTFLEFFCADAILTRFQHDQVLTFDEITDLYRRHWADVSWREVLRLLAGAMHARHTAKVIELLTAEVNQPWPPAGFAPPPWNLALAVQCLAEVRDIHAVAAPAEALLRRLVLLLEHCVAIDDRETAALIEDEILPAAKAIGPNWPGREVYLSWYRRRGVRVVWSPVSTYAARLAAMLSAPAERIDDLFDEVLGSMDANTASYASVAGLAELAQVATAVADSNAHLAAATRARLRLVKRARDDLHAGVRLAAVQALGERFGDDHRVRDLLVERAAQDGHPGVRLTAVRALGERFRDEPGVPELLRERARGDTHPPVRRAAVQALGERLGAEPDLRDLLLDRLRTDQDAEVLRSAAYALVDRFPADAQVREALITRARRNSDVPTTRARQDPEAVPRRAAVRVLGERLSDDPVVRDLLLERLRDDRDALVLRAAAQALIDRSGPDGRPDIDGSEVRALLEKRAREDPEPSSRRAALQTLIQCFARDEPMVRLLIAAAGRDGDAGLRLDVTRALTEQVGVDPAVGAALTGLARDDGNPEIRLAAVRSLVERVGMDPDVCAVLTELSRQDPAADVRLAAVRALAECVGTDPDIRAAVVERARADNDAAVRLAAVTALIPHAQAHGDAHAVLLDRARRDPDARVFEHAATAVLGRAGSPQRAHRLLARRLHDDSNARVRLAAVRMLVARFNAGPGVRELLLERVRVDPDAELVREAAGALASHLGTDVEQYEALVARADSTDPTIRSAAVRILGDRFGTDRSVRELLIHKAEHDSDVQVRRDVLRVLGERLAGHTEVRQLFVTRLHDQDWSVRAAAVLVLGTRYGEDDQVRALLTELAAKDADPDFRRLAGQTLTWLPGADPGDLPDVVG